LPGRRDSWYRREAEAVAERSNGSLSGLSFAVETQSFLLEMHTIEGRLLIQATGKACEKPIKHFKRIRDLS